MRGREGKRYAAPRGAETREDGRPRNAATTCATVDTPSRYRLGIKWVKVRPLTLLGDYTQVPCGKAMMSAMASWC